MKITKLVLVFLIVVFLVIPALNAFGKTQDPQTQTQATALMRGYRTGYSDGYQAAVIDLASNNPRDFRGKAEYDRGDRAYRPNYGTFEDYRDGYQQGFEIGYNTGFDRKQFDSSLPPDLKRRSDQETSSTSSTEPSQSNNPPTQPAAGVVIPRDTIMMVELLTRLSTDMSHQGDPFQVRVIEPKEFDGAIIDGRIVNLKRAGKVKDKAELQLAFDTFRMPDGRSAKLSAQVIEVIAGGDVGKVDPEGGVQGRDSTRNDVKKVGAASGIGAVIGVITGGGAGAAIGATIGAGVGTAGVLNERGHDIRLSEGQHLRIRTNGDAEIQ